MTLKLKVKVTKQVFVALPIYIHIPNLKGLTKIFFKLSRHKGNLCGGGGITVLNPKYPGLSSGDTMTLLLNKPTREAKTACASVLKQTNASLAIIMRNAYCLCYYYYLNKYKIWHTLKTKILSEMPLPHSQGK